MKPQEITDYVHSLFDETEVRLDTPKRQNYSVILVLKVSTLFLKDQE